jgi:hypothetical protein
MNDVYLRKLNFVTNREELKKQWNELRRLNRQYYVMMIEYQYYRFVLKGRRSSTLPQQASSNKESTSKDS